MAEGTPTKLKRNQKLVKMKETKTFKELAVYFKLSEARIKEIFYREKKREKSQ